MRKIIHVLLTIGLLFPLLALAIGLGDIRVYSALDEPFDAQIPILQTGKTPLDSITVTLATPEQYEVAGIIPEANVPELHFQVLQSANGRAYIQITSGMAIHEPVFNVLLNLDWISGSLMREYSVLLDPASYPRNTAERFGSIAKHPLKTVSAEKHEYGPTLATEDMWAIANKTKPSPNVTAQQNMVAIYEKNPQVFGKKNINELKPGSILLLPSAEDVKKISQDQAMTILRQQDEAWRSSVPAAQNQPNQPNQLSALNVQPTNVSKEGGEYKVTQAAAATTQEANAVLTTTTTKTGQIVPQNKAFDDKTLQLQKEVMEKDREILMLKKMMEQQAAHPGLTATPKPVVAPVSTGAKSKPGAGIQKTIIIKPAQAVKTQPGHVFPRSLFWILLLVVFFSVLIGILLQRRKMRHLGVEPPPEYSTDFFDILKTTAAKKAARATSVSDKGVKTSVSGKEKPNMPIAKISLLNEKQSLEEDAALLEKRYAKEHEPFETGIKLLELFGTVGNGQKFRQYYKDLGGKKLTKTQNNLLQIMSSKFSNLLTDQPNEVFEDWDKTKEATTSGKIPQEEALLPIEKQPVLSTGQEPFIDESVWENMFGELGSKPAPAVSAVPPTEVKPATPEEVKPATPELTPGLSPTETASIEPKDITLDTSPEAKPYSPFGENVRDEVKEQTSKDGRIMPVDPSATIEEAKSISAAEKPPLEFTVTAVGKPEEQPAPEKKIEVEEGLKTEKKVEVKETPESQDEIKFEETPTTKIDDVLPADKVEENASSVEQEDFGMQIDLAKTYIAMGDINEAHQILIYVMEKGTDPQKAHAKTLLDTIK